MISIALLVAAFMLFYYAEKMRRVIEIDKKYSINNDNEKYKSLITTAEKCERGDKQYFISSGDVVKWLKKHEGCRTELTHPVLDNTRTFVCHDHCEIFVELSTLEKIEL